MKQKYKLDEGSLERRIAASFGRSDLVAAEADFQKEVAILRGAEAAVQSAASLQSELDDGRRRVADLAEENKDLKVQNLQFEKDNESLQMARRRILFHAGEHDRILAQFNQEREARELESAKTQEKLTGLMGVIEQERVSHHKLREALEIENTKILDKLIEITGVIERERADRNKESAKAQEKISEVMRALERERADHNSAVARLNTERMAREAEHERRLAAAERELSEWRRISMSRGYRLVQRYYGLYRFRVFRLPLSAARYLFRPFRSKAPHAK
jgi:chromosome segregation ATPase